MENLGGFSGSHRQFGGVQIIVFHIFRNTDCRGDGVDERDWGLDRAVSFFSFISWPVIQKTKVSFQALLKYE
jgi:hypothetical protein